MAEQIVTDEEVNQAVEDCSSQVEAARKLGLNVDSFRHRIKRMRRRGTYQEPVNPETPPQHIKGVSTLYDDAGEVRLQWVKTKADEDERAEIQKRFVDALCEKAYGLAEPVPAPEPPPESDLNSCYLIGDAHFGLRAHVDETRIESYDTKIAVRDTRAAIRYLVERSPASEVGTLVNVGDWLHVNDSSALTPGSKNALDADGRFGDVIDHAAETMVFAITELLKKHQHVRIVNAKGNHDPEAALWLNKLLSWYYANEPRVEVLSNDSRFVFFRWGSTLVGVHHGDRIKAQQLYEAMTRDRRRDWGECDYAYFWTGHIHHKTVTEIGGCKFESFNTLAAPDSYHADSGLGASREMQCLILSKEDGLVARNICSLSLARKAE